MMYLLAFLSGVALSIFLLWAWSLCRAGAQADELAERINAHEGDDPC